jgi:hypothetical protein
MHRYSLSLLPNAHRLACVPAVSSVPASGTPRVHSDRPDAARAPRTMMSDTVVRFVGSLRSDWGSAFKALTAAISRSARRTRTDRTQRDTVVHTRWGVKEKHFFGTSKKSLNNSAAMVAPTPRRRAYCWFRLVLGARLSSTRHRDRRVLMRCVVYASVYLLHGWSLWAPRFCCLFSIKISRGRIHLPPKRGVRIHNLWSFQTEIARTIMFRNICVQCS